MVGLTGTAQLRCIRCSEPGDDDACPCGGTRSAGFDLVVAERRVDAGGVFAGEILLRLPRWEPEGVVTVTLFCRARAGQKEMDRVLVERARGRLAVVDFKAGGKVPTGWADLVEGASLRTYGFQLDAYGDALRRMGRQVDTVALWFVRTGTSVRWTP